MRPDLYMENVKQYRYDKFTNNFIAYIAVNY